MFKNIISLFSPIADLANRSLEEIRLKVTIKSFADFSRQWTLCTRQLQKWLGFTAKHLSLKDDAIEIQLNCNALMPVLVKAKVCAELSSRM